MFRSSGGLSLIANPPCVRLRAEQGDPVDAVSGCGGLAGDLSSLQDKHDGYSIIVLGHKKRVWSDERFSNTDADQ